MHKLLRSIQKEYLLLSRDIGGLVILFVMPLLLIITITSIQDGSFQSLQSGNKIAVLLVDNDQGELSEDIRNNLNQGNHLEIISKRAEVAFTEKTAQEAVFSGDYPLAIVIPAKMSSDLKKKYRKT